jgi:hypothetical protein
MEFPTVSPKPYLYELSTYTFIINKTIDEIWNILIKYFENKVEWNFNNKIMQCKTVSLLDIIEFDIMLFKNDIDSYIIEIRRMCGCRYGFNKFVDKMEIHLNLTSLCEKHTLRNAPDFPCESYDDNLVEVYNHTLELIKDEQPIHNRLDGYRSFGSIKKVYSKSLEEPHQMYAINLNRQEFISVLREATKTTENIGENNDVRIIALASINSFVKFCKDYLITPIWLDEVSELYERLVVNESGRGNTLLNFEIKNGLRLLEEYNKIKLILSS